ncbi:hypothetical protein [Corynebacterium propinquum]|uniref:hypothetical protein n=1 Tax=Corynebacterium propinquum TaxID=43769 RepID=UPI002541ED0C|nr:hypothetical protein [Corynebacterium propinquum]MDK4235411.1 hypothetical protein [Corynebacterium propinquum]
MLNKRVLATAILSLSIAAPTVSNLSPIAQAAPSHLGCGKQVVEDAGFKGDVSIVVAKHLKVSCGLSVQQIAQLSDHELTQVIEELGISKAGFNPALVRAAAGTIDQNTDKPGNGGGTDDLDRDYQTGVSVDRIKAGARTVTGTVYLQADQDEQKISAALPRRNFVTVTAKKKNPGKAELVKFEIPVPESLQLREHHQVLYTRERAHRRHSASVTVVLCCWLKRKAQVTEKVARMAQMMVHKRSRRRFLSTRLLLELRQ